MSTFCRFNPRNAPCDLETEYQVLQEVFNEFNEAFSLLRSEYHELEDYTTRLEQLLAENGIPVPDR